MLTYIIDFLNENRYEKIYRITYFPKNYEYILTKDKKTQKWQMVEQQTQKKIYIHEINNKTLLDIYNAIIDLNISIKYD